MNHGYDFEAIYDRNTSVVIGTGIPNGSGGWTGTLTLWSDSHLLTNTEASVAVTLIAANAGTLVNAAPATYGAAGWWYYQAAETLFDGSHGTIDAYLACTLLDSGLLVRTFHGRLYDRGI